MLSIRCKSLVAALFLLLFPLVMLAQNVVADGHKPEEITSGYEFTEGPYWHPDGYLLFSDIPANTIYKWTPGSRDAEIFMKPSGHSNGITSLPGGELVLAQHDGMVSMVNNDDKMKVLASSYRGKRLNSPNDVTVASDGTIYFTDPPFGVSEEEKELAVNGLYMLKMNKEPELMFDKFDRPNGVVLSPDESRIYVNDTTTGQIYVLSRKEDGSLYNARSFAGVGSSGKSGAADGMVVDEEGRLYSTGPGGIYVFSREGEQLQLIEMPARVTNMEWGGEELRTLFLTTPSSVYRLKMDVKGFKK